MSSSGGKVKWKRVNLTVTQKLELIRKLENGVSVKHVCEEYGVKKQTVSDIRKAKAKLTEYALKYSVDGCTTKSGAGTPRKHMKVGHQDLNEAVYKWYVQQKACGNTVTGNTLRNACQYFSRHLGVHCIASNGWLWRFRNQHGLRDVIVPCEANCAGTASAALLGTKSNELIKKEDLLSQLYNPDETDEESETQVVGNEDSSSSDEEDEMPVTLPKLSLVHKCIDTLLQYVEHTKKRDINSHYGNLKILREAIIKEQHQSVKQLKLNSFKLAKAPTSFAEPGPPTSSPPPSPGATPAPNRFAMSQRGGAVRLARRVAARGLPSSQA